MLGLKHLIQTPAEEHLVLNCDSHDTKSITINRLQYRNMYVYVDSELVRVKIEVYITLTPDGVI